MAFVGVQFDDDSLAVVNKNWLTPRKQEVWWPPFKFQIDFDKAAKRDDKPGNDWTIYKVNRCYFECDNYSKAQSKIINLQYTSDIQTTEGEEEQSIEKKRRERVRPLRFVESDSEVEEKDIRLNKGPNAIKLPKLDTLKNKIPQPNVLQRCPKTCNSSTSFGISPSAPNASFSSDLDLSIGIGTSEKRDKGIQEKLLRVMLDIKEQNKSILKSLEKLENEKTKTTLRCNLPENTPVTSPINSQAQVDVLEEFLNVQDNLTAVAVYLSTIGGRDLTNRSNNILKFLLSDNIAKEYSFCGKRNNKKDFWSLNLRKAIIQGVQTANPDSSEKEIENIIKVWLKHAPQRSKAKSHN